MIFTDDPLSDFDRYDRQQEEWLNSLPVCDCCFEPIMDDYYFEDINGYEVICEECLLNHHRRFTDDYIAERCDDDERTPTI